MSSRSFKSRRKALGGLSDEELNERFWELAEQVVKPLVQMARTHTTPSIERSVLLRAGLSSTEAAAVVKGAVQRGLLGLGAGGLVQRLARSRNISFRQAGQLLASDQGWDEVQNAS